MNDTLEHPTKTLDALAVEWMQAKIREDRANADRLDIERQILDLMPAPEEGATTVKLDNGFKIKLTGKLTYSADDMDALIQACSQWPAHMQPIKTVVQLDATGCKFLRGHEPAVWASIAPHVTVKPAKVAVKVEV